MPVDVRNPCVNTDYVNIECPNLEPLTYLVAKEGLKEYNAHPVCNVITQPIVGHQLCGELTYEPSYDNQPITPSTIMGYNKPDKKFSAETDDGNMVGKQKPYGLKVEFVNWPKQDNPTVSTDTVESTIDFLSPCGTAATISGVAWDAFSDNYSDTVVGANTKDFTVDPIFCDVTYECVEVRRVDGQIAPSVTCASFTLTEQELYTQVSNARYIDKTWPPGDYAITIRGYTTESENKSIQAEIDVIFTLVDPCNQPTSLQRSASWQEIANIEYTITDDKKCITAPAYEIEPVFCPFDVVCTVSSITGDDIIVDQDPGSNPPTFCIDRFNSLDGLGETQTIACKATSKTEFPDPDP